MKFKFKKFFQTLVYELAHLTPSAQINIEIQVLRYIQNAVNTNLSSVYYTKMSHDIENIILHGKLNKYHFVNDQKKKQQYKKYYHYKLFIVLAGPFSGVMLISQMFAQFIVILEFDVAPGANIVWYFALLQILGLRGHGHFHVLVAVQFKIKLFFLCFRVLGVHMAAQIAQSPELQNAVRALIDCPNFAFQFFMLLQVLGLAEPLLAATANVN